jgi:hypothetical protein
MSIKLHDHFNNKHLQRLIKLIHMTSRMRFASFLINEGHKFSQDLAVTIDLCSQGPRNKGGGGMPPPFSVDNKKLPDKILPPPHF